ncbi:restriction endonuclease subunit S [Lactobacillus iners]|jgi:ribosomal protein L10|uniref:restriction endonuclease subunit S n=4 Tax=Lactobacillus iners TaxID=147802 RepID=UPI0039A4E5F9
METWKKIRLGDACKTNMYSYSPKEKWNFVNYLDTGNITDNKIDSIQYIDVVNEKLPSRARRKVKKDSIIYSTVRPNQHHFGIIKSQPENFLVSTGFAVIDTDSQVLDADFLYYLLTQSTIVESLNAIAEQSTSAYPSIKPSDIENLEIEIPDIATQKKIADVLFSLDKKMAQNMEINKNLEQQAQAIFKAWFIDFEPFDEKIPANWVVSKLGDIASIKTNSFSPVKNPDAQLEHYSIPAYDEQKYPVFESAEGVKSNKYILSKNSVMISKLNPDTKRAWRPMCLSDLAVSSTEFIIFEAFNPAYKDFVFSIIDSAAFSDWMCTHTTGSTNSRQRTTPSATLEFQIALPDEKTITDFCAIVTPMYDTISANICENQKLAQLRDSILPKLMSGELDVSNIDL